MRIRGKETGDKKGMMGCVEERDEGEEWYARAALVCVVGEGRKGMRDE